MFSQKALYINADNKSFSVEEIKDDGIVGPLDFGLSEVKKNKDSITFGRGILAGSILPGSHRLIFFGYSPIWENYYISTMGGAAYVFYKTGLNYVCINGKAEKVSVLLINRKDGVVTCRFEDVDTGSVWNDYKGLIGTYALQQYCFDKYKSEYKNIRILVTGPAAEKTRKGGLMSAQIVNGEVSPIDCWAGRGGLGSMLLHKHNIAAIVYGGDFEEKIPALNDRARIDKIFTDNFGKPMMAFDLEKGKKYRFDPEVNSGGTLGVNFSTSKENLFSFNYSSIYLTPEKRLEIHSKLIASHYLKQFNEETVEKKQNKHCGEPCALACKKMNNEFKKDYEPYEALGPNAGIFDQRGAEKVNHYVDAMGFDAIQAGSNVSWIMELISKGLIKKEDFGLTVDPKFDPENFDPVSDSMRNADLAIEIIKMILFDGRGKVFRHSMRLAAEELDWESDKKTINYAVFNAYGENGCMVPNQYWVPGMFSPMPIMGKYFEFYGSDILPPRDLGKRNAERMIKEFYTDNTGMCRFHRSWTETISEKLFDELLGLKINFYEHHRKLASEINENNNSVFWESERVIDIVKIYLERMLVHNPDNAELKKWVDKFNGHKIDAAREYWSEILAGIRDVLG